MMLSLLGRSLVGAAIAVCVVSSVSAKGQTRRLTVTGPTVQGPLEVTDPIALASVWGGEFIGASASEPNPDWPRYVVSFHVQPPRTDAVKVMYVVHYARDPQSGEGFVYLPGPGQEWYRLNASTILRSGDGRWHRAAVPWSRAINARLP